MKYISTLLQSGGLILDVLPAFGENPGFFPTLTTVDF